MTDIKTISTALISVFDKQNLAPVVEKLKRTFRENYLYRRHR